MSETDTPPTTLAWYVDALAERETPYVRECQEEAEDLVANFVGVTTLPEDLARGVRVGPYRVPATAVRRAVLDVGANLYYRRLSQLGSSALSQVEPTPFRHNRNPMAPAYPLLRPYIPAL